MRTNQTDPDKLAEPRYFYAAVENALAAALDIDNGFRTLFRSRIKHFQKLGVTGARPGKGQPLRYSFEQAARLAIVLLIADVGLDPTLSVKLIDQYWEQLLRRKIRQAVAPWTLDEGGNPWFLTLRLEAMRGPWAKQSAVARIGVFQRKHHRPELSEKAREGLKARLPEHLYDAWLAHWKEPEENIGMWLDHPEERNFCVFSLSYVLHRLKDHLDPDGAATDAAYLAATASAGAQSS